MAPRRRFPRLALALMLAISLVSPFLAIPTPTHAGTMFTIGTTADEINANGLCSLREAVINANNDDQSGSTDCPAGDGADTIMIPEAYRAVKLSIWGMDDAARYGDLDITDDLTIQGPESLFDLSHNSDFSDQLLDVKSNTSLTLIKIRSIFSRFSIYLFNNSTLNIQNSDIKEIRGTFVKSSNSKINIINTSISTSYGSGHRIIDSENSIISVANVSITTPSDNLGDPEFKGIIYHGLNSEAYFANISVLTALPLSSSTYFTLDGGSLEITNSYFVDFPELNTQPFCKGVGNYTLTGHNNLGVAEGCPGIIGQMSQYVYFLGSALIPRPETPAIDAGMNCAYPAAFLAPPFNLSNPMNADQFGNPRPAGSACDIGSFEVGDSTRFLDLSSLNKWMTPPFTLKFTSPVSLTAGDVLFSCGTDFTMSGGPTTYTFTPSGGIGSHCDLSIRIQDGLSPINIFWFQVGSPPEVAPTVTSLTPAQDETVAGFNVIPVVNFSEPVTIAPGGITLTCDGVNQPFRLHDSGYLFYELARVSYNIHTFNPLPNESVCTLTLHAALISDLDGNDPPDTLEADVVRTFYTAAEFAPYVKSSTPAGYSENFNVSANLAVSFSELVTAAPGAFGLTCGGIPQPLTVTGGPSIFILNPDNYLPYATSCTLTVTAANITDNDADDPPDNMAADYSITFSTGALTDSAPYMITTTPANNAANVPIANNLTVTFSEPVMPAAGAFGLTCAGTPHPLVVTGGLSSFTLNPDSDLPYATSCTLTVTAANVADVDPNDPPNNMAADYSITFSTALPPDSAPSITGHTPSDNTANFALGDNLTVTFSEPVTAAAGAFGLVCRAANQPLTVTGGPTTFTIDPDAPVPPYSTCRLTVDGSKISDDDTNDPPDNMAGNAYIDFSTAKANTIGVFRPNNKTGYLRYSNTAGNPNWSFTFSQHATGDIPVYGDWNGDGITTLGMFRPANNTWYLKNGNGSGSAIAAQFAFGLPGDIPIVGDWDGNGTDTIGIFRPSQRKFYLRNTNNTGPINAVVNFGLSTDRPVIGDWDGDTTDTPGVWRPSNKTFYLTNSAAGTGTIAHSFAFGVAGDIPLAGDWDGDQADSVGVFRPNNKTFYLRQAVNNGAFVGVAFGLSTDVPMAGVWSAIPAFPPNAAPSFVPKQ